MDGVDTIVHREVLLIPTELLACEQVQVALVVEVVHKEGQDTPEDHPPSETLPWPCQCSHHCDRVLSSQNFPASCFLVIPVLSRQRLLQ